MQNVVARPLGRANWSDLMSRIEGASAASIRRLIESVSAAVDAGAAPQVVCGSGATLAKAFAKVVSGSSNERPTVTRWALEAARELDKLTAAKAMAIVQELTKEVINRLREILGEKNLSFSDALNAWLFEGRYELLHSLAHRSGVKELAGTSNRAFLAVQDWAAAAARLARPPAPVVVLELPLPDGTTWRVAASEGVDPDVLTDLEDFGIPLPTDLFEEAREYVRRDDVEVFIDTTDVEDLAPHGMLTMTVSTLDGEWLWSGHRYV